MRAHFAVQPRAGLTSRQPVTTAAGAFPARHSDTARRPSGPLDAMTSRRGALLICAICATLIVAAPLVGWPAVSRLPGFLVPTCVALAFVLRPWRWTHDTWQEIEQFQPSAGFVRRFAVVVGLLLMWVVWTRFQSGDINAVDFTGVFRSSLFSDRRGQTAVRRNSRPAVDVVAEPAPRSCILDDVRGVCAV